MSSHYRHAGHTVRGSRVQYGRKPGFHTSTTAITNKLAGFRVNGRYATLLCFVLDSSRSN